MYTITTNHLQNLDLNLHSDFSHRSCLHQPSVQNYLSCTAFLLSSFLTICVGVFIYHLSSYLAVYHNYQKIYNAVSSV